MTEWIGWIATALFAGSYFFQKPATLRRLQAIAALMWIAYGLIISAAPIVVANTAVAALAIYSSRRQAGEATQTSDQR